MVKEYGDDTAYRIPRLCGERQRRVVEAVTAERRAYCFGFGAIIIAPPFFAADAGVLAAAACAERYLAWQRWTKPGGGG